MRLARCARDSFATGFATDPFVVPEPSRVGGGIGPNNGAQVYHPHYSASGADIPLDLLATMTMNVTIGTPFVTSRTGGEQANTWWP